MKVFVEITRFAAEASGPALRDKIKELEDLGATGISLWDHIFITPDGKPRAEGVEHACDPLTTLSAIAGISDTLELQTVVVNSDWIHPGLIMRQFAQLAVVAGSADRVTAGVGAGWSKEEFEALGAVFDPFKQRMARFAETLDILAQLRDTGVANFTGTYRTASDLPLSPAPKGRLKLLIGGGSDRIMELAGTYADLLDIHGDPKFGGLIGGNMAEKHHGDTMRRALTTAEGLSERYRLVQDAAERAGRSRDAVKTSVQVWFTAFGEGQALRQQEERICSDWGHIPYQSLTDNPYLLLGSPQQMAESLHKRSETFGLDRIAVKETDSGAATDPARFLREVGPLVL